MDVVVIWVDSDDDSWAAPEFAWGSEVAMYAG
jgi:hypothetical protein